MSGSKKPDTLFTLFCGLLIVAIVSVSESCQKVIGFDLFDATPRVVVEANIYDDPGPYLVRLSETVNFDEITAPPAVTDAIVEISDSTGVQDTLSEVSAGLYLTNRLTGIPGRKYNLTIKNEGQIYNAGSTMPYPVNGFTPFIKKETDESTSSSGGSGDRNIRYRLGFEITDPIEFTNFYRLVIFHRNRQISSRRVFSDEFHNGKIISGDFVLHDTINFDPGETIEVDLQNIDRNTYNFFRTLRNGTGGLSFLSASPSNPVSNISNNGLGYFSACSVIRKFVTIPQ